MSNPQAELLWLATGCLKLYFSSVRCHKPKKVGKHWFTV